MNDEISISLIIRRKRRKLGLVSVISIKYQFLENNLKRNSLLWRQIRNIHLFLKKDMKVINGNYELLFDYLRQRLYKYKTKNIRGM